MIQRKQSLYLLLTSLMSLLFLCSPFLTFFDNSGQLIELSSTHILKYNSTGEAQITGNVFLIMILGLMVSLSAFVTIFFFKNRRLQMIFTWLVILLIFSLIVTDVFYLFSIISEYNATIDSWFKILVPVFQLVFTIMALRGIKKDDELVKSYDRLR